MAYEICFTEQPDDDFGWWGDFITERYYDTIAEADAALTVFIDSEEEYATGHYGIVHVETGAEVASRRPRSEAMA